MKLPWTAAPKESATPYPEEWNYAHSGQVFSFDVDGVWFKIERGAPTTRFILKNQGNVLQWNIDVRKIMPYCRKFAAWKNRDNDYPDDRDDYAREQAIEDGRMEYERE